MKNRVIIIGILYSKVVNDIAIAIMKDVIIIPVNLDLHFLISSLHIFARRYPVGNPAKRIKT